MIGQDTTAPMFKPRAIRPWFVAVAASPFASASRAYTRKYIINIKMGIILRKRQS